MGRHGRRVKTVVLQVHLRVGEGERKGSGEKGAKRN